MNDAGKEVNPVIRPPGTGSRARKPSAPAAPDRRAPYHGKLARALASLNRVLAGHLACAANRKKVVGHATRADRRYVLGQCLRDLHAAGYHIEDVRHLATRHLRVLASLWETRGYSASTLQKRFSILNTFCGWIGKPDLVGDPRHWLADPGRFARHYVAQYDHSWVGQGVDPEAVFQRVAARDPVVALQLRLQAAFGLRAQEAMLLRPHQADRGEVLEVNWGTKGGRPRQVPIRTEAQRQLLAAARTLAPQPHSALIPEAYRLRSWIQHYYYVLRSCGIHRRAGLVGHGLRHGYANDRYEELAGQPSPVRGGGANLDRTIDRAARLQVSGELGHARERITTAYYGTAGQRGSARTDRVRPSDAATGAEPD